MSLNSKYIDHKGVEVDISSLDKDELDFLAELNLRSMANPDWDDFENFWVKAILLLYEKRGFSRKEIMKTPLYRIAQDMGSRIAIASGLVRPSDYRDELEDLVRTHFSTRREFCEATGLSEDMLSHVLARRKHLSVDALTQALGRIGYGIHIAPLTQAK